ncbi:helix-turn-helix domain-containing protein [Kitasatospora indigofera]|uniref:helix-turn-helix domain-containing protein n=1 Tax=Kitasatospora indigofera TaxID=67307 RepID=UPI0033A8186F
MTAKQRAAEYLTPAEAAELARVTVQTLANYRYRGIGPAFSKLSPGRSGPIRYRREDVEKWLAGESIAA